MPDHRWPQSSVFGAFLVFCFVWMGLCASAARAQSFRSSAETWGQTYRPAGLLNLEARSVLYPWIRAETQVWAGRAPSPMDPTADVVVLSVHVQEPTGHASLRAGRFVLATGAVRPVHIDGANLMARTHAGTQLEVFGGAPVVPRFGSRAFDWLAGSRLSQRLSTFGTLGASFVERRDRGQLATREVGGDVVFYVMRKLSLSGRSAYSLVAEQFAEAMLTGSYGNVDRRIEVFGAVRRASLILPATSLFSVLSNAPSAQAGVDGRIRVAPRLSLSGLLGYRAQGGASGLRARLSGVLSLSDEGDARLEGALTRDGVGGGKWTGVRAVLIRPIFSSLAVVSELEVVVPDHPAGKGSVWPWGRLSARYTWAERWQFSAGAEGSSSPQFARLFQALVRVGYHTELGSP